MSLKIVRSLLGRHQGDLLEDMGGRRLLGNEAQLQMVDDPVHGGIIGDKGDDLHHSPALRAKHRVHFVNLANHLRPTFRRDAPHFLLGQLRIIKGADLMEGAGRIHPALGHQEMERGVEIDAVPERLDDGDKAGLEHRPRCGLKIKEKRPDGTAAKIPQELPLELEEHPEHLRDDEDHLTMRNIEEERLPHPLAPLLKPLGMARRAKSSGLAGKHQQMFRPAAWAPDPGKAAARIAAIEIALDDLLDDRPEKAVFPLEPALVFRDEPLEMVEKHPVENGPFRMTRAIDSRHIGNEVSRNAPGRGKGKNPGTATRNGRTHTPKSVENRQRPLTQDQPRNGRGGYYERHGRP